MSVYAAKTLLPDGVILLRTDVTREAAVREVGNDAELRRAMEQVRQAKASGIESVRLVAFGQTVGVVDLSAKSDRRPMTTDADQAEAAVRLTLAIAEVMATAEKSPVVRQDGCEGDSGVGHGGVAGNGLWGGVGESGSIDGGRS